MSYCYIVLFQLQLMVTPAQKHLSVYIRKDLACLLKVSNFSSSYLHSEDALSAINDA